MTPQLRHGFDAAHGHIPTRPRLAISITAHERLRTLEEQLDNIQMFCPDSVVVVHLNTDLAGQVAADPARALRLRAILRRRGVILNPVSQATRWAHMLHAHVANLRLVRDTGLDPGHVLLMSSGDLLFRPGLEDRVAAFDAGVFQGAIDPSWMWTKQVMADPVAARLLAQSGHAAFRVSGHEGTFFRADIAHAVLAMLDAEITDWDYDTAWPKEEVFFPTLAVRAGARLFARPAAHQLGFARDDRRFVAQMLQMMALPPPGPRSLLREWVEENAVGDSILNDRYILSRVPRETDNLLRMLFAAHCAEEASPRAAWLAAHLGPADLLALDAPGRTNVPDPRPARATPSLIDALVDAPARPVFDLQREGTSVDLPLEHCPGRFAAARMIAGATGLCAFDIRATAGRVTLAAADGVLAVQVQAPAQEMGDPPPMVFCFQRFVLGLSPPKAILVELHGHDGPAPRMGFWIEVHEQAPDGLRKHHHGLETTPMRHRGRNLLVFRLDDRLYAAIAGQGVGSEVMIYMRLPVPCPKLRLARLVLLG